jgi:hypothetical protein
LSPLQAVVPRGGFEWVDSPPGSAGAALQRPERWLVSVSEPAHIGARIYDPMEFTERALHRELADCVRSEQGFLDFANEYGALGAQESIHGRDSGQVTLPFGESLSHWSGVAEMLGDSLKLWDAARLGHDEFLSSHLLLVEELHRRALFFWPPSYGPRPQLAGLPSAGRLVYDTGARSENVAMAGHVAPGDLRAAAVAAVLSEVNTGLYGSASAAVELDSSGKLRLSYTPANLLGSIWLQFAMEVTGSREHRVCPQCDHAFQMVRDGQPDGVRAHRSNRKYCSDRCRYAHANHQRRRRAKEEADASNTTP